MIVMMVVMKVNDNNDNDELTSEFRVCLGALGRGGEWNKCKS